MAICILLVSKAQNHHGSGLKLLALLYNKWEVSIASHLLDQVVAACFLGDNWPTIDGNASSGNPFNFGKIVGLLRVTIVDQRTYTLPSYIIVSGQQIIELNKGWYIKSWTISSEELLIETTNTQHVFVTKIM